VQTAAETGARQLRPIWHAAPRLLIVEFDAPQSCLSWALGFGGFRTVEGVAWCEVKNQELGVDADPLEMLQGRLASFGKSGLLGLMTSARVECFGHCRVERNQAAAEAVATVGFGNAVCVGELLGGPEPLPALGTINLLCWSSQPLAQDALCEALSIITEARTRAVMEARIPIGNGGLLATGTGTDCVAVLCPIARDAGPLPPLRYAGKHTDIGYALGAACYRAMNEAMRRVTAAGSSSQRNHG
jgi:adenosylcobinamide amidohydrolase